MCPKEKTESFQNKEKEKEDYFFLFQVRKEWVEVVLGRREAYSNIELEYLVQVKKELWAKKKNNWRGKKKKKKEKKKKKKKEEKKKGWTEGD